MCALTAVGLVAFGTAPVAEAQLSVAQSTVASAVPAGYTPNIDGGVVYALAQVGSWIVAGGSFTSATPHGSSTAVPNKGLVAFDQSTGALDTAFAPTFDGQVNAVLPGPTANTVYVGGAFATVNGVKSKGLTLLDLGTGAIVSGFKPPVLNGTVQVLRLSGGRLYLGGSFTLAGGVTHDGLATVNPTTGALDPFVNVQLTGHHNYNGTGSNGAVGARAMDISPDGSRAIVVGNFKNANGGLSDQIVMLDLNGSTAAIDPNWRTSQFTAACAPKLFDSYVDDVDFAPDGSYFVVVATGAGTFTKNTDGTRALCDSASRWSIRDTGTNVKPTWVDYTGDDTFWSVAVTGTAVYAGGHERWVNNPNGPNKADVGAVPRPGIVALDPANGLPLKWNPGRNPRGAGAYSLLATPLGLYVGSDTDYIGDYKYKHDEIAFFPLAGGYTPASTTTTALPANVYEAGPTNSPTAGTNDLAFRTYTPPSIGSQVTVPNTGVAWSTTRGAFLVGSTLYFGTTGGGFYQASFNGTTVGTPASIDPYDDPTWDNVQTGSGQTYQGVKPAYYTEIPNITGAFYSDGRVYYTQSGKSALFWRYFTPDSGTIGGAEFTATGGGFGQVAGMFASGPTIYYANATDGTLHAVTYSDGGTNGATPTVTSSTDHTVSGPKVDGRDWRAKGMFLYQASTQNQPPTAAGTATCTGLTCSFDGSASTDPDGTIRSYTWTFGDGSTGSGPFPSHTYAQAGAQTFTLVVTDNQGAASPTFSGTANPTDGTTGPAIAFGASTDGYTKSGTSVSLTTPTVLAGDTELLYVTTSNATAGAITTPNGWTPVATQASLPVQATVFRRTAAAGDTGSRLTVTVTSAGPIAAQLLDYANVDGSTPVTTGASDANTASHTAPEIAVGTAGSWVVSFWSDKSSTTTAWSLPVGVIQRDQTVGTGGGHVAAALADSNGPVAPGTYPAQTASVGATPSGKGATISVVLVPAS